MSFHTEARARTCVTRTCTLRACSHVHAHGPAHARSQKMVASKRRRSHLQLDQCLLISRTSRITSHDFFNPSRFHIILGLFNFCSYLGSNHISDLAPVLALTIPPILHNLLLDLMRISRLGRMHRPPTPRSCSARMRHAPSNRTHLWRRSLRCAR
eukprot:6204851-Pleurochrysis_carterae.AAC.4